MASYYERPNSPYFWIRFQRPDKTWGARSSGIRKDATGALRRISQLVADETAKESMATADGSGALLRTWVPGWIDYKYSNAGTLWRYRNAWAHLDQFFKARRVLHPGEVTYALCHEFMRWRTDETQAKEEKRRKAAWNTALLELRMLGAVMQEAVRRGLITANPCGRLGIGRQNQGEKREITREEEDEIFKLLRAKPIAKWMAEVFLVGMRQGCRLMEARVPLDRIDEKAMSITFRIKGGKFHTAPLHKDLLPLVKKARKEKREVLVDVPPQASVRFGQFFERKGFVGLCFHCTRVTVVTRLCRAGFSESQTMAYVGHADALVHAIYRKLKPRDVAHLGDVL